MVTSARRYPRALAQQAYGQVAIEASPAAPVGHHVEEPSGTDEVRALLAGYADVLDTIDDAPPVLWARVERPCVLCWLRIPAPRALVRTMLVRHVSRRVGRGRWCVVYPAK